VLMTTFLHEAGIDVEPIRVALWGIPTAVSAFAIHAWRLRRLDRRLAAELADASSSAEAATPQAAPAAAGKLGA